MRQLPLVLSALLIPANAVSAVHYHTKTTTYACVDPRALSSRDPIVRAQGRCFKVVPRETWERISRSPHSLVLLRIKPPHPGEPPLYFRRSALVLMHPHRRLARHHRHEQTEPATPANAVIVTHGSAGSPSLSAAVPAAVPAGVPGAASRVGGPVATSPLAPPNAITPPPPQAATVPASVTPDEAAQNPVQASNAAAAPPPSPAQRAEAPGAQTAAVKASPAVTHEQPRAHHVIWPLLLWAVMIAFAGLLVQLVLRRRPSEAAPAPRRESATVPRSSIWEPVHPDLPGIVEKLETGSAAEANARPEPVLQDPEPGHEAAGEIGAGMQTAASGIAEPISLSDYKNGCVARLRHAGWDARTRFTGGQRGPDVIARHNGLVLALQCHPSASPVDVEAVEDACLVRERQRSDLAAIVSNATYTEAARQLAARTGIVLLHEDQLASFAA